MERFTYVGSRQNYGRSEKYVSAYNIVTKRVKIEAVTKVWLDTRKSVSKSFTAKADPNIACTNAELKFEDETALSYLLKHFDLVLRPEEHFITDKCKRLWQPYFNVLLRLKDKSEMTQKAKQYLKGKGEVLEFMRRHRFENVDDMFAEGDSVQIREIPPELKQSEYNGKSGTVVPYIRKNDNEDEEAHLNRYIVRLDNSKLIRIKGIYLHLNS